jgi:hypothetical protein
MAQDILQSLPLQNVSTKGNGNPFQRAQAIRRAAAAAQGANGGPGLNTAASGVKAFVNPTTHSRSLANQTPDGTPRTIPTAAVKSTGTPTPGKRNPDGNANLALKQGGVSTTVDNGVPVALENQDGTFMGPEVAKGNNRTTPAGLPSKSVNRTAQTFSGILAAGETRAFPLPGNNFRIIAASGPMLFRPGNGPWMLLYQGMSYKPHAKAPWEVLELQNPNVASSLTFAAFAGFGKIFDNRTTPNTEIQTVTVATGQAAIATPFPIPDLSGTIITAQDGTRWYAVSRSQLVLGADMGTTVLLNAAATVVLTSGLSDTAPLYWQSSGKFNAYNTTAILNIAETYLAVPVNLAA